MANLSNLNNKFIVTDGGQALVNQTAAGFNPDADDLIVGNLSGNTGITIASGSSAGNYGSIYFADAAGSGTASKAGYIRYEQNTSKMTFGINAVEKVAIDLSGDVGIGVTPEAWSGYSPVLQIGDRSALANYPDDSLTIGSNWYYDGANKRIEAGYATRIQLNSANGKMFFETAGTDSADSAITFSTALTILNDGNVGIGTTTPDYKLEVESTSDADLISVKSTAIANNTQLRLGISGNDSVISGTGGSTGALSFKTYGTQRMYIDSSGNVGIGTGSPQNILHLKSNDPKIYLEDGNAGSDEKVYVIYPAGSQYVLQTQTDAFGAGQNAYVVDRTGTAVDTHKWYTANSERMRIDSSGNVGIGTASPAQSLDTTGKIRVRDGGNTTIPSIQMGASGIDGLSLPTTNTIAFITNSTERMRIDSSGKIGTGGVTAPLANLDIGNDIGSVYQQWSYDNPGANDYNLTLSETVTSGQVRYCFNHRNAGTTYSNVLAFKAGSVGMGTNDPDVYYGHKLVVVAPSENGMTIAGTGANQKQYVCFADGTSGAARYAGYMAYDHNINTLSFATNGGASALWLDDDQRTNAKIYRVEQADTSTNIAASSSYGVWLRNTSDTDGNFIPISFSNSTGYETARIGAEFQDAGDRNTDLFFMTRRNSGSLTERLRIDSYGALQLGGESSAGFIDFDGTNLQFNTQRNPNTGTFVDANKSHASIVITGADADSYIRFYTNDANNATANERVRITKTGSVGINNTAPGNVKLYTVGTAADWTGIFKNYTTSAYGLSIDCSGAASANYLLAAYTPNATGTTGFFVHGTGYLTLGKTSLSVDTVGIRMDFGNGETFTSIANGSGTHYVRDTTNTVYRFYVTGGGQIHATSTSITAISDITLKENIKPLETGLDEVMKLKPRRFDWKNGDGKNIAGFVAQEVEEVLPDLVSDSKYNDEETKKALKMGDMIPTLVNAIQELKAEIELLKSK